MKKIFLTLLLAFCVLMPVHGFALISDVAQDDDISVRLISDRDSLGDGNALNLGLDVKLAPEQHTYWRSPGMAGSPPVISWGGSDNLQKAELSYPIPARYNILGIDTIGYKDSVLFPIRASIINPHENLKLAAKLDILVCGTMCVPKHFNLELIIPAGAEKPSPESSLIQDAIANLPKMEDGQSGITITNTDFADNKIIISFQSKNPISTPNLFIENDKDILFTAPVFTPAPDSMGGTFTVAVDGDVPAGIDIRRVPLTITLAHDNIALEKQFTIAERAPVPTPNAHAPIGIIILFALLGGFILNLMPCVLPVLSLKALSLSRLGGKEAKAVRYSFLTTACGIIFSFLTLALMAITLKSLGHEISWGAQFQHPAFLVFLIIILTLFTANLWGFFSIRLPNFLMNGINNHIHHNQLAGDFATGAFATLLATPCSAPFLGTAVGFALMAGTTEILIIFTALGLGMALPYLAIATWPRIATSMPRPGHWMVRLRIILGLALGGTALWLIWVLSYQISSLHAYAIGGLMLVLLGAMAMHRKRLLKIIAPMIIILAFAVIFIGGNHPTIRSPVAETWQKFDPRAIERHIANGKIVFVDITADWCLTCKVNKQITLLNQEILRHLFYAPNVVAMQGDWTNPDPVIADFLRKHGRFGIPFNAVFSPRYPQGKILPELLTPSMVIEALDDAEK